MFKERFEPPRTANVLLHLVNLPMSQSFPARSDWGFIPQAIEKELDLIEGKTHITGEPDEQHTVESIGGIPPLTIRAMWGAKKAALFVVPDGRSVEASAPSEFSNFHFFPPIFLDRKDVDLNLALTFSICGGWWQTNRRRTMSAGNKVFARSRKARFASIVLCLLPIEIGTRQLHVQRTTAVTNGEKMTVMKQTRFYCNMKALNPEERTRHKQLTDKLIAARKEILETESGYEFQYGPSDVSLAELAEWVVAESKCCPFFDFHIDLEHDGALLCLRLTGEEGIKPFIRAEFDLPKR
jgi:hypothetical protein